jgi:hypothetical protein
MTLPSNGITQDVIREMMPPYHLSDDLLAGTMTALPPPPPDASAAWRQAHLARLVQEISGCMPADATQARIAVQILIVREMADTLVARAYAPGATIEQMCRLARNSAELVRTSALLVRTLAQCQQKPAPFFGNLVADQVDVAALDAVWCGGTPAVAEAGRMPQPATPEPATGGACPQALVPGVDPVGLRPVAAAVPDAAPASAGEVVPVAVVGPEPAADPPDAALPVAGAEPSPAVAPMAEPAGPTGGSVVTRLDQGPGWTLEVVRPATSPRVAPVARPRPGSDVGIGATPEFAA